MIIKKIGDTLALYESTVQVDHWDIEFKVGLNYETRSLEEIKTIHDKLTRAELNAGNIKLLAHVERGRLYSSLKYSQDGARRWESVCNELDVCRKTADRYIDFSQIICAYPRLLICGLSFETIVCYYKMLQEYLMTTEDDLADRLKQPLREIRIVSNLSFPADQLPGEENPETPPPDALLTEHEDDCSMGYG